MHYRLAIWDAPRTLTYNEVRETFEAILGNERIELPQSSKLVVCESAILPLLPAPGSNAWRVTGLRRIAGCIVVRIKQDQVAKILPDIEDIVADLGLTMFGHARPIHGNVLGGIPFLLQKPYVRLLRQLWSPIDNPGPIAVSKELAKLKPEMNSFLIVSRRSHTYLQTLICPESAAAPQIQYQIEYQERTLSNHWQAFTPDAGAIEAAFHSYARGEEQWRTMFAWNKLDLTQTSTTGE